MFVGKGSHCATFSWSLQAINKGSDALVLKLSLLSGSAPKQITCLSISLTNTCNATVGALLAPLKAVSATALWEVPELSSQ